jgi:hypothetical protein
MIAQPTRRLTPATDPAPTGPTPFADSALELYQHGLAPIPLGGDDGKVTLPKWRGRKHRFAPSTLQRFAEQWPNANVGILTGLSGVTVVDIDDLELMDDMVRRFGDTPLKMSTPSGGVHLWFKSSGERNRQCLDDLAVDLRGVGGMVVVPPSVRPSGHHKGKPYAFLEGSWDDLCRLPNIKPSALAPPHSSTNLQAVRKGNRDNSLFRACLEQAPHCDTVEALLDVAQTLNATYLPPMKNSVVVAKAEGAWQYQIEGRNWLGQGAHIPVAERMTYRLMASDKRHGPDALVLYVKLRAKHAARDKRGKCFAVVAKAMARDKVLPWSDKRIYCAIDVLVKFGLLERVKKGGHGKGDTHQYRFRSPLSVIKTFGTPEPVL